MIRIILIGLTLMAGAIPSNAKTCEECPPEAGCKVMRHGGDFSYEVKTWCVNDGTYDIWYAVPANDDIRRKLESWGTGAVRIPNPFRDALKKAGGR